MTPIKPLTRREWEVVSHLLQGKSNKQIALSLDISIRTVEFHLKNIYAKHQVASRIELFLELGKAAGQNEIEKPGYSTVVRTGEKPENGDKPGPGPGRAVSYRNAVSMTGRESDMKKPFTTRYAVVGIAAALCAGLLWIALLRNVGNMSPAEIKLWIAPMILIWAVIGGVAGLAGKRNGSSLPKVGVSALAATGLSPIAILPLMGFVVLPFAKLLEKIGLIDGATMPRDTATTLAILAMLAIWLMLGTAIGSLLSFITVNRPEQKLPQTPAA